MESCLKRVKFDLTLSATYLGVITGYVMSLVPVSFIRQVRTRFRSLFASIPDERRCQTTVQAKRVTGQLADTPTRGLNISRTGQLADATGDFACLVFVFLAIY